MAVNGVGKNVPFGAELGRGGEGSVFEITSASSIVAKVYHQALQPKKQEKILTMVRFKQEQLLKVSTWPMDVLKNHNNEIIGFIMPKLKGKEIHKLYGPKTRLLEFPRATYPFLVHTAANLARAFAAVHESGHVIGDVNHGNFYVSDQGIVTLVDCDSFQIRKDKDIYRCEVGIPMYQPPELQNITSYREVLRTTNHDNFGLAVFIFMLLFMGRHPFAGRYAGPEDMPIEKAIEQFRFAYSINAASKQMKPPPGTLSLTTIPLEVVRLFERAFESKGTIPDNRPSAEEWVDILQTLSRDLRKCSTKEQHHYSKHLSSCPWCDLENKTGVIYFLSHDRDSIMDSHRHKSTFDLNANWARITAVSFPPLAYPLPNSSLIRAAPSQGVIKAKKRKRNVNFGLVGILIITSSLMILFPKAFVIILFTAFCSVPALKFDKDKKAFKGLYELSKEERDNLISRWDSETKATKFYEKYHALESAKKDYQGLEAYRNSKIKELQSKQREIQLGRYLQSKRIDSARIEGIGPSRTATLQSFGIETAADISERAIRQVPRFGPTFTERLLDWRDAVSRQFVFNANQLLSPRDITALDNDISIKRRQLEKQLLSGVAQLQQLSDNINEKRSQMHKEAIKVFTEFVQAETDFKSL